MKIIRKYRDWKSSNILENAKAAKAFMIKREAERFHRKVDKLTEDEVKMALDNKEYKSVLDLIKDKKIGDGYIYPFVKFFFDHKASLEDLSQFADIIKNNSYLIGQLSKNVDSFASMRPGQDMRDGFEIMMDELRVLIREKDAKWLFDEMPKKLKDEYRNLPIDKKNNFINASIQLKKLDKQNITRIISRIKTFENSPIEKLIDYVSNYVLEISDSQMSKTINKIEKLDPEASILYEDGKYLAISIRTHRSQVELCSIASWCLNTSSEFFRNYVKDALQINIFNFGLKTTDSLYLTGNTVDYNNLVTSSYDINNRSIKMDSDPYAHFIKLGYPEKMANEIMSKIPSETAIKRIIYEIKSYKSTDEALKGIIRKSLSVTHGVDIPYEGFLDIINISFKKKDIMEYYLKYGVISVFSAKIFKSILNDVTKGEMDRIIKVTKETLEKLDDNSENKFLASYKQIKNVVSQKDEVFKELGILKESIYMAPSPVKEPATKPKIDPGRQKPLKPSPIPRKKPFTTPEPAKAQAQDVIERFDTIMKKYKKK
jgi:hypothetical protein